jgi:hypothetical protein
METPSGRAGKSLSGGDKRVARFARVLLFTPDGSGLCVGDGPRMEFWDLKRGEVRWRGPAAAAVALSPDGTTLAAAPAGEGPLTLLDTATGKERARATVSPRRGGGANTIAALAFSSDGRRLAAALHDGHLCLCDGRTGAEVKRFKAVDRPAGRRRALMDLEAYGGHAESVTFSPDGKWLVTGGSDASVRVWEAVTGKEVLLLDGHEAEVARVAFGPDGRALFSWGADGQVYLWGLKPAAGPERSPDALWDALAGADAAAAYRAVWALSETKGVGKFLRERVAPVKPTDAVRLAKWIADLNSPRFRERDEAAKGLAKLGELAVPALEKVLAAPPSVEVHQRVRNLLEALKREPSPLEIRRMRAVQALELAGTAEARATLRAWAGGASGARLTEDARAALRRLDRRDKLDDQEVPDP